MCVYGYPVCVCVCVHVCCCATGLVAIPAGGGATFLGGWLVKRLNLDIRQILKFCFVVSVITVGFGFIFLIHCANTPFAGISTHYLQPRSSGSVCLAVPSSLSLSIPFFSLFFFFLALPFSVSLCPFPFFLKKKYQPALPSAVSLLSLIHI